MSYYSIFPKLMRVAILFFLGITYQPIFAQNVGALNAIDLRVEYLENPVGIDITNPRFSWVLTSEERAKKQSAYQILVASSPNLLDNGSVDLWNSGKVISSTTNQIEYSGKTLESRMQVYWKVRSWDNDDNPSEWSDIAYWSMGLLNFSDWEAGWIGFDIPAEELDQDNDLELAPSPYLRTEFETKLESKIERATVYVSAMGLFELRLNGERIGEDYFTPGWTDYHKRIYYFTYDVTDQVEEGANAFGAILSDGWYAGYVGYGRTLKGIIDGERNFWGRKTGVRAQLEIEYADGDKQIISTVSDLQRRINPVQAFNPQSSEKVYNDNENIWVASTGPLRESDILMGETYDSRLENLGWDRAGFDDAGWQPVTWRSNPRGVVEAYPGVPVQIQDEIRAIARTEPSPGTYIFDFGKNFAGVVRLRVRGDAGTKVVLRYGEMLHTDGSLMTENLRAARSTDTYILNGGGDESWLPQFTYHGFQFVEVTGYPGVPEIEAVIGIAMNSSTQQVGEIEFEGDLNWGGPAPLVTQLFENIKTTQFANFFDVPTDCPQRDERMGWTGDAQVYFRTSAYIADVSAFFTKWMRDVRDAQLPYGAYSNYAPIPFQHAFDFSPGWMDGGVILPYMLYRTYGDKRLLEEHWNSLTDFMEFQKRAAGDNNLRPQGGQNFGDWLVVGYNTDKDFIASAYYAYDLYLMAEMAEALGKADEARSYRELFSEVKAAFLEKYLLENGKLTEDSQTAYSMALAMRLYPEELEQSGADRLAELVIENGSRLETGIAGVSHLLPILSKYGHEDIAYRLLMQTEYPSWGYSVINGATSIWERWNSYTKEGGFMDPTMNSFSHYANGSVGEWMFSDIAGIDINQPGYTKFEIKPLIKEAPFSGVSAEHKSISGMIKSSWTKHANSVTMEVSIPANTTAEVYVPAVSIDVVTERGDNIANVEGVVFNRIEGRYVVFDVQGGQYKFMSSEAFERL